MIANLRIGGRIALGFGLLIALLIITSVLSFMAGVRQRSDIEQLVNKQIAAGLGASDMLYRSMLLRRFEKDLIINLQDAAKVEEYKQKWDKALAQFKESESKIATLVGDDGKDIMKQFDESMAAYSTGFSKVHEGVKSNSYPSPEEANKAMSAFKKPIHEMEEGIGKFQALQLQQAQDKADSTLIAAKISTQTALTISFVAIALGLVAAWLIARSITKPLGDLQVIMADIEQSGDLTRKIPSIGNDEISHTSHAFNNLIESLRLALNEAQRSAAELRDASLNLNNASEQVSKASGMQVEAASSTAAAVEQMTVSIGLVASNSRDVEYDAKMGLDLSRKSTDIANTTSKEIKLIADVISQSTQVIGSLSQRSQEIGGIAQVIKDIADQTNLLALNAAIEAARAGEQGRGFAVVADEVRKLAERTSQATAEISRVIDAVQQDTHSAVRSMSDASERVNKGVTLTEQVSSSLDEISHFSSATTSKMAEISTAIAEQSAASTQIAQNIEQIAQMSDENSNAIRQTTHLASRLRETAETLDSLVRRFRIHTS
ncbi:methyl-accepting chemotaxis protein [Chitinivorax tropicus]|uniref:Methyl-accepting chemotaxis protein n=1 Tax=Chitinivorax tropicus TaxID=714531 RepID=A0A840MJ23_9PROT|nr:methyl-accepting chemotaxis protein [Chitinivorax tropicus]MBB5018648.1 methyl-accepting chemotaxis protein [Chitinivorax tropicus]